MCESHAYVIRNGQEEKILEDVTYIKPEDGSIHLQNLFGKKITIKGHIEEIRLMEHKILLRETS